MESAMEQLIGVQQLAERLQVKTSWVYTQAAANAIPAVKIGKYLRFSPIAIDRWLESRQAGR